MRCISAVHWKEIQNVENLTTKLQNIFAISFSNGYILLHLLFFLINCILKKIAHHRKASIFKIDHQENKGNQTNKAKKNKNKVSWLTCSPFHCTFHVTIVTITKKKKTMPKYLLKRQWIVMQSFKPLKNSHKVFSLQWSSPSSDFSIVSSGFPWFPCQVRLTFRRVKGAGRRGSEGVSVGRSSRESTFYPMRSLEYGLSQKGTLWLRLKFPRR